MATFREVNIVGETIWLNIETVVSIGPTEGGKTPVKLCSGDTIEVLDDREELFYEWGIFSVPKV